MKKILLSAILALSLTACSTDDTNTLQDNSATISETNYKAIEIGQSSCFPNLVSDLSIDLANGINNPIFTFIGNLNNTSSKDSSRMKYLVSVDMQALADCEDITTGTGKIIRVTNPEYYMINAVQPSVTLQESQLMAGCYRWRVTVTGYTLQGTFVCVSSSSWKDAPVY